MFQNVPVSIGRKRVFDSVFQLSPLKDLPPTPVATPDLGSSAPGQSFGGHYQPTPNTENHSLPVEAFPEQVIWDRSWHTATSFLSLPEKTLTFDRADEESELLKAWLKSPTPDVSEALFYVGSPSSRWKTLRVGLKEHDLKEWYTNEVRRHFLTHMRPALLNKLKRGAAAHLLRRVVRFLQVTQEIYSYPLANFVLPLYDSATRNAAATKFRQDLHAIVAHSLPQNKLSQLLSQELTKESRIVLGIVNNESETARRASSAAENVMEDSMDIDIKWSTSYKLCHQEQSVGSPRGVRIDDEPPFINGCRERLLNFLHQMQDVGLGGSKGQKIFADVMNNLMTEFVRWAYAGHWDSPSMAIQHLRQWTENVFARLIVQVLNVLRIKEDHSGGGVNLHVKLTDVDRWQEMGIARLGALRTSELFDIIVEWNASAGAIEDLQQYSRYPATRTYLTSTFSNILSQRLLQPGASTVQILQLYISIIRAFKMLDPKGVLLDRVARPIRRYLRERDDTVRVIVRGLLVDTVDSNGQPIGPNEDTLTELASELTKATELALRHDEGDLDWDDMSWVPDPIDAAPDYKKSKNSDVIGSLISLFETKDVFVKELQMTLGERLLRKKFDFDQEISVLELLKLRFGDSALQACEVMLRDVLDSRRVDNSIRLDQKMEAKEDHIPADYVQAQLSAPSEPPQLHAKILSRLFWPTLQDQTFKVPSEIASLQELYAKGFESLKQSRKLTWLNALGQVTVELDLEDRVFKGEVLTWQASVVYAFQSPNEDGAGVTKTVQELARELEMDENLVRSACIFWLSKRILIETSPDTYRVLEVLPEGDDATNPNAGIDASNSAAAAAQAAAHAAKSVADNEAMEKMKIYWQFIVGMLANQGSMPLQRIIMMLKIAVPGGFPYSNEELKEFLARMVQEGKIEVGVGGNYRIVS